MADSRIIRVFIASPGDLAVERQAFKEVIKALNDGFGDGAGVKYEPLGWEDTLASTGRRSQSVINRDVDLCDVFVLAMHRRWGQDALDAQPYSSYTEEEFHRAFERWQKTQAPEIFVFFKHVDPASMADPGPQLQKVLAFRKHLEDTRHVLYRPFADEAEFKTEVDRHLRAFTKGELPKADAPRDAVLLPMAVIEEMKRERNGKELAFTKAERKHQLEEAAAARTEALALQFAERAAQAALAGRVEEARQDFAQATNGTTNLQVLFLAFEFYARTGDLAMAEELAERSLAISGRDAKTSATAAALGNLGRIYDTRGVLDRAEEMQQKALAINEKLGHQLGMAFNYGNLGVIYAKRGELNPAEEMHQKALAIYEKLRNQVGMSTQYGNLALLYQQRGELERAEELHEKGLAIDKKLGRQEGLASNYGNLGLIYALRGELERAEEMFLKSLAIDEKLGRQEAMATDYTNLGRVAKDRGDRPRARELWTKARDLYAKIGMPQMFQRVQGLLDELAQGGTQE